MYMYQILNYILDMMKPASTTTVTVIISIKLKHLTVHSLSTETAPASGGKGSHLRDNLCYWYNVTH